MKQFKTTKQTLASIIVVSIVSMVAYISFFNHIKGKNEEISIIANEIDVAVQKEIKLKSIKNLIADTENDRKQLETYFVTDDKIVDFIEEVENIGKYAGANVEIMSVSIGDDKSQTEEQNTATELLHLGFKVNGKWSNVFQFFALLEKLPFKIDIAKANLEAIYRDASNGISSGDWKGFFNITAVKSK